MNVGSCPSASRAAASRKLNRLGRLFYLGSAFVDRVAFESRRHADTPTPRPFWLRLRSAMPLW